jgi:hypothetical protein
LASRWPCCSRTASDQASLGRCDVALRQSLASTRYSVPDDQIEEPTNSRERLSLEPKAQTQTSGGRCPGEHGRVVVLIPRTTIIPTKRGARANYRPDVWHIGAFDTRRNALHGAIPLFELGQIVPPPRLFVHFPLAICSCNPHRLIIIIASVPPCTEMCNSTVDHPSRSPACSILLFAAHEQASITRPTCQF